jgi:hypothetical protein
MEGQSMKAEYFVLSTPLARKNCMKKIEGFDLDGSVEVIIRNARTSKTLAQLGGMFGGWISYLSDTLGESQDSLHRALKRKFLARIYVTDPQTDAQEQWVELLAYYQERGDTLKFENHVSRISLSWATIEQMNKYMNAIEQHYIAEGIPLPILDKFRRYYDRAA